MASRIGAPNVTCATGTGSVPARDGKLTVRGSSWPSKTVQAFTSSQSWSSASIQKTATAGTWWSREI